MNQVNLIGRLGQDVEIRTTTTSGDKVATMSVATDEGYRNRDTGKWVDRTEWHRLVAFSPGLVDMLEKHGDQAGVSPSSAPGCARAPGKIATATSDTPPRSCSPAQPGQLPGAAEEHTFRRNPGAAVDQVARCRRVRTRRSTRSQVPAENLDDEIPY